MEKDDMQSKIFEISMLENKLKQLDQQLNMIEQQIAEDQRLEENLKDLKNNEKSDAILPLGGGIFARGSLNKTDKLLVNIGAGILSEKSLDEAREGVGKRKDRLLEAKEELGKQMQKIVLTMSDLEKTIKGN
ncbi:prefoldin subunit alpha [Nanoarchaeota archaeon]